jgi:hypothetical protein
MGQKWDREADKDGGLVAVRGMRVKECPMATFTVGMPNNLKIMLEFISKMEPGKKYGIYDLAALLPDDLIPDLEKILEFRRHNNHWAFQIINLSVDIGIFEMDFASRCYFLSEKAQELKVKLKNQHDNEVVREIEQRHKAWMNATESLADIIRRKNANQEDHPEDYGKEADHREDHGKEVESK